MVGNDPNNDLHAGKLGIKTYLITDEGYKTSSMYKVIEEKNDLKPDYSGKDLKEFFEWLKAIF
jgi:FMN phosphatase YigB (HAD superfamily)